MTVYIVTHRNPWNDAYSIEGVFSTRKKAKNCITDILDDMSPSLRKEEEDNYHINEHEVDAW